MTRQEFIAKATRAYERRLGIPAGWWGTYNHVVLRWFYSLKALLRYHVFGVHKPGFVCWWCRPK